MRLRTTPGSRRDSTATNGTSGSVEEAVIRQTGLSRSIFRGRGVDGLTTTTLWASRERTWILIGSVTS